MNSIVNLQFLMTISAVIALVSANYNLPEKKCITPYGKQFGKCVFLEECPSLVSLSEKRYKTSEEVLRLSQFKSLCVQHTKPKVCCPITRISPIKRTEAPPPPTTSTTTPTTTTTTTTTKSPLTTTTTTTTSPSLPTTTLFIRQTKDTFQNRFSLPSCGISPTQPKIIGGAITDYNQYPWLALLEDRNKEFLACAASLINEWYLLTAAHCLRAAQGIPKYAVLGEYNRTSSPEDIIQVNGGGVITTRILRVALENPKTHPDYDFVKFKSDIAIIKMKNKVEYTDTIKPICLPETDYRKDQFTSNTSFYTAGWGYYSTKEKQFSDVKRHVTVPYAMCLDPTENQICAGGEGDKDSCRGDSGGPLMYYDDNKFVLVGIVSSGRSCGRKGIPGIYTYVYNYLKWIIDTTKQ